MLQQIQKNTKLININQKVPVSSKINPNNRAHQTSRICLSWSRRPSIFFWHLTIGICPAFQPECPEIISWKPVNSQVSTQFVSLNKSCLTAPSMKVCQTTWPPWPNLEQLPINQDLKLHVVAVQACNLQEIGGVLSIRCIVHADHVELHQRE